VPESGGLPANRNACHAVTIVKAETSLRRGRVKSSSNFSFFSEKDHKQPGRLRTVWNLPARPCMSSLSFQAAWPVGSNRGFGLVSPSQESSVRSSDMRCEKEATSPVCGLPGVSRAENRKDFPMSIQVSRLSAIAFAGAFLLAGAQAQPRRLLLLPLLGRRRRRRACWRSATSRRHSGWSLSPRP